MRRVIASILFACASPAMASAQPTRPAGVSTIGPWEAVQWVRGRTVSRCTLIRETKAAGTPGYGFLVDREGVLLSVETPAWKLTPDVAVAATLTPQAAGIRRFSAKPVSAERANIDISKDRAMLDDLQKSERLEVQIGGVKVDLPFDDFNAARVVLEICVQKIGTEFRADAR